MWGNGEYPDLVSSFLGDVAAPRGSPVGYDAIGVSHHYRGRCGRDPQVDHAQVAVNVRSLFLPASCLCEPTPARRWGVWGIWGEVRAPSALWRKEGLKTLSEKFDALMFPWTPGEVVGSTEGLLER